MSLPSLTDLEDSWIGFLAGVVVISYDVFTVVEAAVICLVLVGALMIYTLVTRTQVRWLGICM